MAPSRFWWIIPAAVFAAAAVWGWQQLQQYEEFTALEIQASRETELGLPVYAQFTVTQLLELASPLEIVALRLPIYVSKAGQSLEVELRQADETVQRWRFQPTPSGIQELSLSLDTPRLLAGSLAVAIKGQTIPATDRAQAPRLFIEPSDEAYPGGHYKIANNDKKGDVALELIARQTQAQQLRQAWETHPLEVISRLMLIVATLIFISALPPVLLGRWADTNRRTT